MRAEASRPFLYPHFWRAVQTNLGSIRVAELPSHNTSPVCGLLLSSDDTIRRLRTDRSAMLPAANGSLITPAGQTAQPFNAAQKVFGADPAARMYVERPQQPLESRSLWLAPSHAIRDSRSGSPMQSVEPNTLQRVVVSANGRHEQALFWLFTSSTIRAWRRGSQGCASNQ